MDVIFTNVRAIKRHVLSRFSQYKNEISTLEKNAELMNREHNKDIGSYKEERRSLKRKIQEQESEIQALEEELQRIIGRRKASDGSTDLYKKLQVEIDALRDQLFNVQQENRHLNGLFEERLHECSEDKQRELLRQNIILKRDLGIYRSKFHQQESNHESKTWQLKKMVQECYAIFQRLKEIVSSHGSEVSRWSEYMELVDMDLLPLDSPVLTGTDGSAVKKNLHYS